MFPVNPNIGTRLVFGRLVTNPYVSKVGFVKTLDGREVKLRCKNHPNEDITAAPGVLIERVGQSKLYYY